MRCQLSRANNEQKTTYLSRTNRPATDGGYLLDILKSYELIHDDAMTLKIARASNVG